MIRPARSAATALLATICLFMFCASIATAKPAAGPAVKKVAVIRLSDELREHPSGFSLAELFTPGRIPALSQLLSTLDQAAKDPTVAGVVLDLKAFHLSMAQSQELGTLISNVRHAGKRVIVYSADYDMPTYLLASYADRVVMPEQGDVLIPGVHIGLLFFKGLLDKVHVQADMIQIGQYKGASEPFTRTQASPQFQQEINSLADAFYGQIIDTIAANRHLDRDKVKAAVDEAWLTGKRAKELGLVDRLMTRDQADQWIKDKLGGQAQFVTDYGRPERKSVDFSSPLALFQLMAKGKAAARSNAPAIAVVYANGTIMPDQSNDDLGDDNVTPSRVRKAVKKALDDDRVKAIVLRVDSPGGSASASDDIWHILRDADKTKPITVSMGRVAASGGYYISCAGRNITADPATITGSIGVVGGKVVFGNLLDRIGINVQEFQRGRHAGMLSAVQPFTAEERTFIQKQMEEVYDLFKSRVKESRGEKIHKIDDVAQGRVFDGHAALKAGLVDQVGTLDDTVRAAAKAAGIADNYQVLTLPEPKTLADILHESLTGGETRLPADLSALLASLPIEYRRAIQGMWMQCLTLRDEHVLLALPAGIVQGSAR